MLKSALQSLYTVLAFTVLVLVVVIGVAFYNLYQLGLFSERVEHTSAVLTKAEDILSSMKDAETGQRGYLVTNDVDFLDPYFRASRIVTPTLRSLDSLTTQDGRQSPQMDTLWFLVNRRFFLLDRSMQIFRKSSVAVDDSLRTSMKEGKNTMDSIRTLVREIKYVELKTLKERELEKAQTLRQLPVWLGVLSVLAVIIFGITFFFVIRQVRQRIKKEMELEMSLSSLRRLNDELENFTYVASHHLQEPMRKVRLYADRLTHKHATELSADGQHTVSRMEDAAGQIQTLIDDLLTFTQFAEYKEKFPFKQVSLQKALRAALSEHQAEIEEVGAEIKIQGEFPLLYGNEIQLEQMFFHLIGNSLKFVADGQRPVVVIAASTVMARNEYIDGLRKSDGDKRFCKITCTDNGIGLQEANKEKIFRLFQRLHHKSEYPGTGVGLAICKKVVTNHDGYLDVRSEPGEGATFTVYLPLSK